MGSLQLRVICIHIVSRSLLARNLLIKRQCQTVDFVNAEEKACLRLNIDATTRIGNIAGFVARFVNHSCDGGNLCTSTKLIRSSGGLFPRLFFFALKDIQKDEELTLRTLLSEDT
ncbi:SET-domain containing protein lysine methyltransferase family protein [Trifolium repens]|nr:SET-domain containing protein lysine methyltransferase family protein [Trifolium repens]